MCRTVYEYGIHCTKATPKMSTTTLASRRKSQRVASTWGQGAAPLAENGLSRERIVAAAVTIADRYGLAAVSIRKIAAQLGSSAMSLYHYIPSKRDLTNLMLDSTNTEFGFPAETITDWRGALSHFAWENRRCLNRHPWVSQLRSDNPEYGPECIRTLELLLANLARFGLDVRTSIQLLGALFIFVTGFVAEEKAEHGRPRPSTDKHPEFSKAILATGRFPNVVQFVEMRVESPDELFERALNWMLDGIAADIEHRRDTSASADPQGSRLGICSLTRRTRQQQVDSALPDHQPLTACDCQGEDKLAALARDRRRAEFRLRSHRPVEDS